jgi:hypothetical protein
MTKIFISLILLTSFCLCGMGFANPEGVSLLNNSLWESGFYLLIFTGLASVGLIDLFDKVEGVSRR